MNFKKGFNLLKEQLDPPTVWSKIYDWIVGTARLIVIVVEIIVVVAFGIRLVVDVQSKDLDEQIATKETNLKLFQDAEARFVRIQNKTAAFDTGWTESELYTSIFAEINGFLPEDAIELSVRLDGETFLVTGKASESEVGRMETAFKNSTSFINTELIQIQSQGSSSSSIAEFTLRSNIRGLPTKTLPKNDI